MFVTNTANPIQPAADERVRYEHDPDTPGSRPTNMFVTNTANPIRPAAGERVRYEHGPDPSGPWLTNAFVANMAAVIRLAARIGWCRSLSRVGELGRIV